MRYCSITRQISARVFVGYDIKSSNGSEATQDCNRLDAGAGVNFTVRF